MDGMNKIDEAAARLKAYRDGVPLCTVWPILPGEGNLSSSERREQDRRDLADAMLDRLAADEAERIEREKPIDKSWLWSLGALEGEVRCGYEREMCWDIGDDVLVCFARSGANAPYFMRIDFEEDGPGVICNPPLKTRGQLLDLLRAIGGDVKGVAHG